MRWLPAKGDQDLSPPRHLLPTKGVPLAQPFLVEFGTHARDGEGTGVQAPSYDTAN